MTKDLRKLQLKELEILVELRKICEENNITYYLTAGSLLGAVRHKGFIPWDDDIDVVMLRKDYDKFERICRSQLADNYFYQSYHTDSDFPFYFSKIRLNDTEVEEEVFDDVNIHKGIYIDIFPLDYCPKNSYLAKLFFKLIEMTGCIILNKVSKKFEFKYEKKYAIIVCKIIGVLPKKNVYALRELIRKLFGTLSDRSRLATVGGAHGYPYETYDKDWFKNSIEFDFEGEKFSIPMEYHKILSSMYGDYMRCPDEVDIKRHFERMKL